jgi:ribonuclease H2 subunit A
MFPTISFTVCPKADSLFKIVGAASIVAKVTRDRYIEYWVDPEGSGAGAGARTSAVFNGNDRNGNDAMEVEEGQGQGQEEVIRGSGYPSDPRTQAFLKESLDPVFGYKGIVRFSWATVKVLLDKQGVECKWCVSDGSPDQRIDGSTIFIRPALEACRRHQLVLTPLMPRRTDDAAQPSAAGWFSADADNARPKMWRDLGVSGVGEL